jgi:hypothetical protein
LKIDEIVKKILINERYKKRIFKKFLKNVNPEIAVVVTSYANNTRIKACKELGVPVIELQHGIINKYHLSYNFPDNKKMYTFPDYILTFGEYWCDCANYPIDYDKIRPVGYPHLEQEYEKYKQYSQKNQIIFISQGNIGEEMSKYAAKLAESTKKYKIVYKLHPGEYDSWHEKYPWLKNTKLQVVDSDDPPLYQLFAESKYQVGVSSTALYEGLNFNLETYLLDSPNKILLEDLINKGVASVVSSVDELIKKVENSQGKNHNNFNSNYYFKSNAVENILFEFGKIIDENSE